MIGPGGRADAGAFLVRLLRLDPGAVVRLRPSTRRSGTAALGEGEVEIWAMLPFRTLVVRTLRDVHVTEDITVEAAALLGTLGDATAPSPARCDESWRWPLPSARGQVVERIPPAEIARLGAAASRTLREVVAHGVGGRALGERVVRDALLDHVPIVVTGPDGERIEVGQRLVQAIVRMDFLGRAVHPPEGVTFGESSVTVRRSGTWIGLDASYGSAWYKPVSSLGLT